MTHALEQIPQVVADNYLVLSNKRKEIAVDPAVLSKMSQSESLVLEAGCKMAIASMRRDQFEKEMIGTLKYIARDVGITYWSDEARMMERIDAIMVFTARYYRDMTSKDIRTAFDLCLAGKIDEFLPKDKYGDPDKKHYNEFGKEYFSRIMKAYKSLKTKTWAKANNLIPEPVTELTPEQKNLYRTSFIETIKKKFRDYRDHDVKPNFMVPFLVLKEFKKAGVIDGNIEVTKDDVSKGFLRMTQDKFLSHYQKHSEARAYEDGKVTEFVESKAIQVAYEKLIVKVFDEMIESDLEIGDVIKE